MGGYSQGGPLGSADMKRPLLALLLGALFLPLTLFGAETATIGAVSLKVPLPEGFARFDGANKDVDKLLVQMVPPINRLLMVMAPPDDVAAAKQGALRDLNRYMMLQTFRQTEKMTITTKEFAEVLKGVDQQLGSDKAIAKQEEEINAQLKRTNDVKNLKVGETAMLGIYQRSDEFVDMGMMLKAQVAGNEPKPIVSAISIAMIRGKVVYIYVYSAYKTPEDITWTRKTVKEWRESITAANKE